MIYYGNELYHYGIEGQKWGERRFQYEDGTLTPAGKRRYYKQTSRQAKKDAKEYARAKMFYGEGAGNRRKLINASVNERMKDKVYKEEFEKYLSQQDLAKHAEKAKAERHRKDAVNSTKKTIRGAKNTILGTGAKVSTAGLIAGLGVMYLVKSGKGKELVSKGKDVAEKVIRKMKGANYGTDLFREVSKMKL